MSNTELHEAALYRVQVLYPHSRLSDDAIELMATLLQDIPIAELVATLKTAVQESDFMPNLRMIREVHRRLYPERAKYRIEVKNDVGVLVPIGDAQ